MSSVLERSRFVLVIGGGQAGLAAGYWLKRQDIPFLIVEGSARIGDVWRQRYASLSLFTTRAFSALPGMALAGKAQGYAGRDEFADYLEAYARRFALPIRLSTSVQRLRAGPHGSFLADLSDGGTLAATHVIVATGGFQAPVVPAIARGFGAQIPQLTPESFGAGESLPDGPVLVVGDGASGRDLAVQASASHPVMLATGKPRKLVPERVLGQSIWWWLRSLGLMRASSASFIGKALRRRDPFPDRDRGLASLARRGIELRPRLTAAEGDTAVFADGERRKVAAVVWAVGYRDRTDWIEIPGALGDDGRLLHDAGVSPVPGIAYVGRPWQRNRASALVMGRARMRGASSSPSDARTRLVGSLLPCRHGRRSRADGPQVNAPFFTVFSRESWPFPLACAQGRASSRPFKRAWLACVRRGRQ